MTDQMKATSSKLYSKFGTDTPNLERLADSGVRFDAAVTPHPLCVPARVSLWRSQYPHTHGSRRNELPMPDDQKHAIDIWKRAGYECGLIGKNHCFESQADLEMFDTFCDISHIGLSNQTETKGMDWVRPIEGVRKAHSVRRNMEWSNPKVSSAVTDFPLEDYSTGLIASQVSEFLKMERTDPFALWVSFPDPHEPYEVSRHYADLIDPMSIELPPWDIDAFKSTAPEVNRVLFEMLGHPGTGADLTDLRKAVAVYQANVRFIDDAIGRIIDTLESTGLREDTIVVFCSDHGDFSGEHRMMVKGGVFYDCLTRVPLIFSWPGVIASRCVEPSPVNLIDIVPTLLSLQNLDIPDWMQGKPLPGVTDSTPAPAAFSEYGAGGQLFTMADLETVPRPLGHKSLLQTLWWREAAGRRKMVRTNDWKLVHDPMGDRDELYDLKSDPWELYNVIDDHRNNPIVSDLMRLLADFSISTEDGIPVPLPPAELRKLKGRAAPR